MRILWYKIDIITEQLFFNSQSKLYRILMFQSFETAWHKNIYSWYKRKIKHSANIFSLKYLLGISKESQNLFVPDNLFHLKMIYFDLLTLWRKPVSMCIQATTERYITLLQMLIGIDGFVKKYLKWNDGEEANSKTFNREASNLIYWNLLTSKFNF
jgi:hypothetical protein